MSETGHGPAPRSVRGRLQESPRPSSLFSSSARPSLKSKSKSKSSSSSSTESATPWTARPTGELWPGQAAQEAAREAAQALGAPPLAGYRPSAYQDQYLASAALQPFVDPRPRPGSAAPGPTAARPAPRERSGSLVTGPETHQATPPLDLSSAGGGLAGVNGRDDGEDHEGGVDHEHAEDDESIGDDEPRSRRGRTIALVGGLLAIVTVGAGGAFAYSALGGGGPQPETALPSTTVAFVKVDLDPSAGQKVDAVRFLRAFPQARDQVNEKSDLRQVAFTALQKEGQLEGVDFRTDVAPWLGQRLGLGLVPGASTQDEPTAVLALAVTDRASALEHLPKIADALGGACQVVEDFAVCTRGKDGSALDAVLTATARGSLAEAATFRQDMSDLGEDGVVAGWVDSAKAATVAAKLPFLSAVGLDGAALDAGSGSGAVRAGGVPSVASSAPYADAGRTAVALRFDGPHLELAGHTNGAKASFVGTKHVTGVTSLPWDSLGAVSIANGGAQLRAVWPELEQTFAKTAKPPTSTPGATPGTAKAPSSPTPDVPTIPLSAVQHLLGITVPDELYAALGSQFTLVFGGVEERNGDLKAAIVGDGDQVVLGKLAKSGQEIGMDTLTLLPSPGRSVLATSDEYGQEVVTGSGLGDMPSFRDAVKDVEDARAVVYVDIAGMVTQFKDEMSEEDAAELSHLSALGITVSGEGTSADFRIRLTTK